MKLKKKVHHTSGVRHKISIQKNLLSKYNNIFKSLKIYLKSNGGRNNTGRITVRHQGAGCKKLTSIITDSGSYNAIVVSILYDPKRKSFLSLNYDFKKNIFFNTIAVKNVFPGSLLQSKKNLNDYKLGFRSSLTSLPLGSILNSININKKTSIAKSAGTFCQLIDKQNEKMKIRLPSGQFCFVSSAEYATLGTISNTEQKVTSVGKAGRNRLTGIRPSVRGIAMNPVDHPHGGKSNKGKPPVTPWGIPTKNKPTVLKKKYE